MSHREIEHDIERINPSDEYDVNIRILAFATSCIIFILVAIFCIRTYVTQKQEIIRTMHLEGEMLETFCSENMNHTWYVIHLLATQIKKDPHNVQYIHDIFRDYMGDKSVHDIFGWTEFIWFDSVHNTRVYSSKNTSLPLELNGASPKFYERIYYEVNNQSKTLQALLGVKNDATQKAVGSVLVNFDLNLIITRLKARRKHEYTNVALVGEGLKVVIQSTDRMQTAGLSGGVVFEPKLVDAITQIGFDLESSKEFSHLDMSSGQNFYVKKVKGLPFVLLVNLDEEEIKYNLYHSVAMKFLEISMIAACFLLVVIFIYRRETWLRKKAEVSLDIATRATNAKSDFLAFTAHEIRSPLGFIVTGSEVMKKGLLGEIPTSYTDYVNGIHKNAVMILEFITDILDEVHILEGNFKIINNEASVEEIIKNSISINNEKLSKKNLNIDLDIENDLPGLLCDARRILQVVNNLLSNAAQYSFENTTVHIIVRMIEDKMSIEIIDQGVGMTEDEVAIAFAKYGTVRKKDFHFVESYGLGLPIVKMLLDAHEAELIINTRMNMGTSFQMIFPADRVCR
ncbi:MAG: HAMP domain-containing sensor histidine kinase [Pseudomonadota bacterium]